MKKSRGFTLVEIIVVIGIIAITLPATFAIIFAIVRQQAKTFALKQVKREGDFVLNVMEAAIRNNAIGIFKDSSLSSSSEVCDQARIGDNPYTDNLGNFYFADRSGKWFRYFLNNWSVTSQSAGVSPVNLSTSQVQVSNFSLSCYRTAAFSPPIISISFDVLYNSGQFREQFATLHYQTQIGMKNY